MSTDFAFTTEYTDTTALQGRKDICVTPETYSVGLVIAAILEGSLVIIGNVLVLVVLCRHPPRKFTALNWLLGHLATADLITGAITLWWFGISEELAIPLHLNVWVVQNGIGIVAIFASFEGLAMIALDRYLLILHPQRYPCIVTKKRLLIALVIMWLVPIIINLVIPLSGWSCVDSCDCRIRSLSPTINFCLGERCSQIQAPLTKLQLLLASAMGLLNFCVTIALYVIIFHGIRKKSKKIESLMNIRERITPLNTKTKSSLKTEFSSTNPVPCATEPKSDTVGRLQNGNESEPNNLAENTQGGKFLPVVTTTTSQIHTTQPAEQDSNIPESRENNVGGLGTNVIECQKARTRKALKKRDLALMKSLFIIMSVFSITTLPLLFFIMFTYTNNERHYNPTFSYILQVTILNSLVNPFLYFWRIPTMRQGLIKLLHLQRCHPNCLFRADRRRSNTTK